MLDVGDRRDKGTGSTPKQRADGRWQSYVTMPSGRRRYVYARTEKACGRRRDDLAAQALAGVDPSAVPFAVYLDRYLARRLGLDPASVRKYATYVCHVRRAEAKDERGHRIADKPIARLTTDDVETLYAGFRSSLAPKTIEGLHGFLHGALAQAVARGRILRNPSTGAERPKVPRTTPKVLDGDALRALMDAAEGTRLEAYVAILATTGLRPGEVVVLRWDDVDWERGCLVLASPEKDGVPRSVPLAPRTIRALRSQKARCAEMRLRSGGAWDDDGHVFPGRFGGHMEQSQATKDIRAIAGGVYATPRLLRHSVATELLRRGVPMKVVQELLGHRSMKQTADTYSHVSESMMAAAMAAMSAAVGE